MMPSTSDVSGLSKSRLYRVNTSMVTTMHNLFRQFKGNTDVHIDWDISHWDTSNVTNMYAIFEGTNDPMARNVLEGSGHTVSFQVRSEDQRPPYSLNGLYINYVPSGRR